MTEEFEPSDEKLLAAVQALLAVVVKHDIDLRKKSRWIESDKKKIVPESLY
jgi:hypothetical protein